MSPEEFKTQYLCTFEVDENERELDKMVSAYLAIVDSNASNRVVAQAKKELLEWVRLSGYTNDQYRASVRRCQSRDCGAKQ